MKMYLSVLLSALASTAAAKGNADKALTVLFEKFSAGDMDGFYAIMADDLVVDFSENWSAPDYPFKGHNQVGKNGFSMQKFVENLGNSDTFHFETENYLSQTDENKAAYKSIWTMRHKATGERYRHTMFTECEVNDDGIFTKFASYELNYEKIDAASVATRNFDAFKNGNVQPYLDSLHKEKMVLVGDMSFKEWSGTFYGFEGVVESLQHMASLVELESLEDGTLNFNTNHVSSSADGKTAVFDMSFHYTRKSEPGSKYFDTLQISWEVDDFGKALRYEAHVQNSIKLASGGKAEKEL